MIKSIMNAYIKEIVYYLPQAEVTNEAIVRDFPEWSVEKIASKVGVEKRHVAVDDETASDMAIKAAECLFQRGKIKREDIDFVLFCTQSPDFRLHYPASIRIAQGYRGIGF